MQEILYCELAGQASGAHGRMQAAWALWWDWAGNLWAAALLQAPDREAQVSGRQHDMHHALEEGCAREQGGS